MSTHKRALSADNDTERGTAKKARGNTLPLLVLQLVRDSDSFFSVVPADVLTALRPFICGHRRVWNPEALRVDRVAVETHEHVLYTACFDRDDNIVLPLARADEVRVYSQRGELLRNVGRTQDHHRPIACVGDSRGRLYVLEDDMRCVSVFGADGSVERRIRHGGLLFAYAVALSRDESTLYVTSYDAGWLKAFRTDDGALTYEVSIDKAMGVATFSNGQIAVATWGSPGSVHVFSAEGVASRSFGGNALRCPWQIAIDADDNVYVTNDAGGNVVVFSASGTELCKIEANDGTGAKFYCPSGVAIDSAGTVAVTDNSRVWLFKCA
jgi:sugar lactone lactonase YvrE